MLNCVDGEKKERQRESRGRGGGERYRQWGQD